jgi:hypothetical protein
MSIGIVIDPAEVAKFETIREEWKTTHQNPNTNHDTVPTYERNGRTFLGYGGRLPARDAQ